MTTLIASDAPSTASAAIDSGNEVDKPKMMVVDAENADHARTCSRPMCRSTGKRARTIDVIERADGRRRAQQAERRSGPTAEDIPGIDRKQRRGCRAKCTTIRSSVIMPSSRAPGADEVEARQHRGESWRLARYRRTLDLICTPAISADRAGNEIAARCTDSAGLKA